MIVGVLLIVIIALHYIIDNLDSRAWLSQVRLRSSNLHPILLSLEVLVRNRRGHQLYELDRDCGNPLQGRERESHRSH